MGGWGGLVLLLVEGLFGATPARACSLLPPQVLVVDSLVKGDEDPPATPILRELTVARGRGAVRTEAGLWMSSSCDDIGSIAMTLERPEGDPDGDDDVGYALVQLDGTLPRDLALPPQPILGPDLVLHWIDGSTDEQESFGFTVAVTPVDVAGNEGAALEVLVAHDGGTETSAADRSQGSGCATGYGVPSVLAWAVMAATLVPRRRSDPRRLQERGE